MAPSPDQPHSPGAWRVTSSPPLQRESAALCCLPGPKERKKQSPPSSKAAGICSGRGDQAPPVGSRVYPGPLSEHHRGRAAGRPPRLGSAGRDHRGRLRTRSQQPRLRTTPATVRGKASPVCTSPRLGRRAVDVSQLSFSFFSFRKIS